MSNSGFRRDPLFADRIVAWLKDRYARRRAGDAEALRPFLLVASFVNPHDIVLFPAWARRSPLDAVAAGSPARRPRPHRRRGPAHQTGRADRLPRGLLLGIRPGTRDRPHLRAQRAALPRPLLPAARRGRRAARPGAPRGHRGRLGGCRAGAHLRSRRSARRPRRPAPEVVQPLRRGHPGAVHHRPHRRADDAGTRRQRPTSHVDLVPTLLGAAGVDVDAVADELAAVVLRGAPAAGPRPDARRRRRAGRRWTAPST